MQITHSKWSRILKCRLFQKRIQDYMSRYAFYYVYAAIKTLTFKIGQNVSLIENLTDTMLDEDNGF